MDIIAEVRRRHLVSGRVLVQLLVPFKSLVLLLENIYRQRLNLFISVILT